MAPDWQRLPLGNVTNWSSGGTPRKSVAEYWNGSIPWISASSMKSTWICDSEQKITSAGLSRGSRLAIPGSTLLLVRGSELHNRIPIGMVTQPVAFNQDVKAITARPGLHPCFLLYWLLAHRSLLAQKVESTGIGAGKLDTQVLQELEISVPPIEEQEEIISVLKALDDRIELNRRMDETLEATAMAIYREWVAEPALDQDGTGRPAVVEDLVDINPNDRLARGVVAPYLGLADLPTHGALHVKPTPRSFTSGSRFQDGDTLLARITPSLENGKTALVHSLGQGCVGWGSTEFIVLRPKPPVPPAFGYLLARDKSFRAHAIQSMTGTSGRQRVQLEAVKRYPVRDPGRRVWLDFDKVVSPLFESQILHHRESQILADIRDALLPKLISGELRLAEAERLVSEAI
jgi:type I restriction enzyme S subunit